MIVFILSLGIIAWWVYISFEIIDLHRSLSPSNKCIKAMAELPNAQTLEDLDQQLQMLKERFPKIWTPIETAYQTKKNSLTVTYLQEPIGGTVSTLHLRLSSPAAATCEIFK